MSVINTVALFLVFFQCYMVEIRLRVATDRVFSVSYKSTTYERWHSSFMLNRCKGQIPGLSGVSNANCEF